ncbi:tRNA (adenosine(37)-N6)-dimethylallyltransferase MiaA [Candidatus Termititenax persephonae]|uniref:tRNA dimethylallyltransferase n=1 Tax=Candidatus Termititenax persephonae TaxID=2218525 RepID=A0A388TGK6_9BACT|nr:tRNA (adenosine(37)-N6)-dimethylallyltransferase MiaA [Candidatus Termititenax persephonae]
MSTSTLILGPTGVGKSEYAVRLALEQNAAIVSVDALQVYKKMNIGTAKLSMAQRQGVPHYAIDLVEPTQEFSVADYVRYVENLLRGELAGRRVIFCGGTGFYYNALLKGLGLPLAAKDEALRQKLRKQAEEKGREWLWRELQKVDEPSAAKIHAHDVFRVIRALEVYALTGRKISAQQRRKPSILGTDYRLIGLTLPRPELYARLDRRVEAMLEHGLVAEVKGLLALGCTAELSSMQAIGYKEIIAHLRGDYALDAAVAAIKQKTRNFAKRQYTWFRAFQDVEWRVN